MKIELTDQEVLQRIDLMDRGMKRFRDGDIAASKRFRDVNALATGADQWEFDEDGFEPEGGDVPDAVPVGQPNWLTINIMTQLASIAMGDPDLHVKANEDEQQGGVKNASQVVAKAWKQSWINGNWKKETNNAALKWDICGLGAIFYRWDGEYGPCIEHTPSWRLLVDPHVTNFRRLEYGGVKVKMPLRKAVSLYDPNGENEYFTSSESLLTKAKNLVGRAFGSPDDTKNLDNQVVSIRMYFDRTTEVHAYNGKVIYRGDNPYKRVPLIFLEGFPDPTDNKFPLGMNVLASGLQQAVTDLTSIANNMAKHGGQITIFDPNGFDAKTIEAMKKGEQQGMIPTKGPINPQAVPIHRISAEQLAPAWNESRREMQYALDGMTGVTPAARGEMVPNVTATQSVQVENRAAARPIQAKNDYEAFLDQIATVYVEMMQQFGGPTEDDPGTDEQKIAWEAFKATYEVRVVEGSTSFRDPSQDQQQSMQVYGQMVQSAELYVALSQLGVTQVMPNMKQYADDMLRAFSRQNIEQYWVPAPQTPPQQDESGRDAALAKLYSEAPEDIRRQIEQTFGFQPSEIGGTVEGDGSQALMELPGKKMDLDKQREAQAFSMGHDPMKHQFTMQEKAMDLLIAKAGAQKKPTGNGTGGSNGSR